MGSQLGPNYAYLFMGHIEEQIFEQCTGTVPALYKRYIDDIIGATSSRKGEMEDFAAYVNGFHPSLKFTWSISDEQLPFLDLYLKPTSDWLITSIYYKETDIHSYLNYASSHPIPYSQFLRLPRICSDERGIDIKSKELTVFFINLGYPQQIIQQARNRVVVTPQEAIISEPVDAVVEQPTIPLVKSILTSKLHLLRNDPDTAAIFQPLRILSVYRRDSNLRDSLVRSTLCDTTVVDDDRGTFPCGRSRCNTCTHTDVSAFVDSPGGCITINNKFMCTSKNVVYVIKCRACSKLYIGETGRRLGDRFLEHLRSTRTTNTDLSVARHFTPPGHSTEDMLVSAIRSGFQSTYRRCFEAKLIFQHLNC